LIFFLVGVFFSFSGTGSTVATGLGGDTGTSGAGLALDLVIASMANPIPSARAARIPSAIVAYRIVLSVLQMALTV